MFWLHRHRRSECVLGSPPSSPLTPLTPFPLPKSRNRLLLSLNSPLHPPLLFTKQVQQLYEKQKHDPPIPRNMPPVAGNITWSRHLLKRIEEPMKQFERNQNVLAGKDAKRIIKIYNKVRGKEGRRKNGSIGRKSKSVEEKKIDHAYPKPEGVGFNPTYNGPPLTLPLSMCEWLGSRWRVRWWPSSTCGTRPGCSASSRCVHCPI